MSVVEKLIYKKYSSVSLPTKIEWVNAVRGQGDFGEADRITKELLKEYADNEDALQKIDCLLDEPCSKKMKALVAKINKEGIAHYEAKNFSGAVEAFRSALVELPQIIGLHLNFLQSLVELLKQDPAHEPTQQTAQQTLRYVAKIIPPNHAQYHRFCQLEEVYKRCLHENAQRSSVSF